MSVTRDLKLFRSLACRHHTPEKIQRFLREEIPYNFETDGETLKSAASALRAGNAHCLEAALVAAALMEQLKYPTLVMSMEAIDDLDHVVFVYKARTGWGSIGRSRVPGLHGRAPRFKSLRNLALSYADPFVDKTGALTGFGICNLAQSGADWRGARQNVWKVEQFLIDLPHQDFKITPTLKKRWKRLRHQYLTRGPILRGKHWW